MLGVGSFAKKKTMSMGESIKNIRGIGKNGGNGVDPLGSACKME